MPRIPQSPTTQPPPVDPRLAEWHAFEDGFSRNARGNISRLFDGATVTVFKRRDGTYCWCIAEDDHYTRFSAESFDTEEEALSALGYEFFV